MDCQSSEFPSDRTLSKLSYRTTCVWSESALIRVGAAKMATKNERVVVCTVIIGFPWHRFAVGEVFMLSSADGRRGVLVERPTKSSRPATAQSPTAVPVRSEPRQVDLSCTRQCSAELAAPPRVKLSKRVQGSHVLSAESLTIMASTMNASITHIPKTAIFPTNKT